MQIDPALIQFALTNGPYLVATSYFSFLLVDVLKKRFSLEGTEVRLLAFVLGIFWGFLGLWAQEIAPGSDLYIFMLSAYSAVQYLGAKGVFTLNKSDSTKIPITITKEKNDGI